MANFNHAPVAKIMRPAMAAGTVGDVVISVPPRSATANTWPKR